MSVDIFENYALKEYGLIQYTSIFHTSQHFVVEIIKYFCITLLLSTDIELTIGRNYVQHASDQAPICPAISSLQLAAISFLLKQPIV